MSQENVEIVRRHVQAYLSGDNEPALAAYHPEVEFDASLRPEGHVYRGREGGAEAMRVLEGNVEDWTVEVKEIIDAGDRVLVIARESWRGRGGGTGSESISGSSWYSPCARQRSCIGRASSSGLAQPEPDLEVVNALYQPDHVLTAIGVSKASGTSARGDIARRWRIWTRRGKAGDRRSRKSWTPGTMRGGARPPRGTWKIAATRAFQDAAGALEAVGLRE